MDRAKKKGVTRQKRLEYPDDIHISESLPQGKTNKQTNKQTKPWVKCGKIEIFVWETRVLNV